MVHAARCILDVISCQADDHGRPGQAVPARPTILVGSSSAWPGSSCQADDPRRPGHLYGPPASHTRVPLRARWPAPQVGPDPLHAGHPLTGNPSLPTERRPFSSLHRWVLGAAVQPSPTSHTASSNTSRSSCAAGKKPGTQGAVIATPTRGPVARCQTSRSPAARTPSPSKKPCTMTKTCASAVPLTTLLPAPSSNRVHPPSRGRVPVDERPGGRPPSAEHPGADTHLGVTPLPAGGSPRGNMTRTGWRKVRQLLADTCAVWFDVRVFALL